METLKRMALVVLAVTNLRSGDGHLAVSVFSESNRSAFPGEAEKADQKHYVKLDGRTALEIPLEGLSPGVYGIALLHDENSDGKLNTNWLGIPKEGFGFSNNPGVYVGAPSFEKVKVKVDESTKIEIRMKYFL